MCHVNRWLAGVMVVLAGAGVGAVEVSAQARDVREVRQAEDVRTEFRQLLEQFPPALGVVLKSDPTLMTNAAYLSSYPPLAKYLADHPEIARDPAYFLSHVELVQYVDYRSGRRSNEPITPADQIRFEAINMWRSTMDSVLFLMGFAVAAFVLAGIIRYVVEHRRWLRSTRVQSEAHNKLLERFSSSAELAAYMESPAGAKFLAASPLSLDAPGPRAPSAPFSRILWSTQAGVVLIAAGIGFLIIQRRMVDEVAQIMGAWGTLAIAVGVGFVISGAMSYVISSRMGLLGERKE
jgi:hypothetical protein